MSFIVSVYSSPVETDNDDDDYLADKSNDSYDDNDYGDDVDEKPKPSTSSNDQSTEEPYKTQEYTEKAEAGQTLVLKCLGTGLDASFLYMWYNGSTIIAQGAATVSRDERISFSKKDGYLTIRDVSSYDDGIFRCRAFSEKSDRYETIVQVNIRGPPRGIVIGHNINAQKNIAGETLVYRAGENNLRFNCNVAKARPEAKIDWVHNGNTILESQQKDHDLKIEEDGVLVIKSLHARHAGDYQCEASNEFGNLKASFRIDVQCKLRLNDSKQRADVLINLRYISDQPFFMHHTGYFNAEEGGDVEIHCLYKSFPAPKSVKWLKGGSKIHDNDKYKITNDMREHHDRTKLLIRNVNKNDMILYECDVEVSFNYDLRSFHKV